MHSDRREFLGAVAGGLAASGASAAGRPQLGMVVSLGDNLSPEQALAKVHRLGLPSCQLGVGMAPANLAASIREAAAKYGIHITALMTLGEGRMVWDLRNGPLTIGIIPRSTRPERMQALRNASDLAHACGVDSIHTHCGFIPEDPNDPLYAEAVKAIHEVATYCRERKQTFLCETGQESPITLLRAIQDVGLDNVKVNLDMANLILYGKGEPVGALDVLGTHVRGTHAKDGKYPTDPYGLGEETPIGQGEVRFAEVFRKLHRLGYAGPLTIEREISGPQQEADLRTSIAYLTKMVEREYSA